MAPGSGTTSVLLHEGPRKRSKSAVKSPELLASSKTGVKRSPRISGYIGDGKRGSNQRDDGENVKAMSRRAMTGTAKAFPTVFAFRLLWQDLVSASIDSRKVQSSEKPSRRSASMGLIDRMSFSSGVAASRASPCGPCCMTPRK